MDETHPFQRDYGVEQDFPAADEPAIEAPPMIGLDERRMHVRAYNYWVSLLDDRPYPSIDDLEPAHADFGTHSVLLDFTSGPDNASIRYLGATLRAEGGLPNDIRSIAEVPARSVLSRLTDHYLEIIANRAPIGFEAEYVSHRAVPTMYRGILMPFTSNGDEIDFIYGVINWKDVVEVELDEDVRSAVAGMLTDPPAPLPSAPVWADGPSAPLPSEDLTQFAPPALEPVIFEAQDMIPPGSILYDRLAIAREAADALNFSEQRTRASLYAALGQAYDFALAAADEPEGYAEILEDAGLKMQQRAPMTPIVKLIFGVGYDKTRLAEYAVALSHALRQRLPAGTLPTFLEGYDGGLKGIVQTERLLRRPSAGPDREAAARIKLTAAPTVAALSLNGVSAAFVSLIARREADGRFAIVSVGEADAAQLVRAAKQLKQ
jgi:hypothetical protein